MGALAFQEWHHVCVCILGNHQASKPSWPPFVLDGVRTCGLRPHKPQKAVGIGLTALGCYPNESMRQRQHGQHPSKFCPISALD